MGYQSLASYYPRSLAFAPYHTLQNLARLSLPILQRLYNADIVGAVEHYSAVFARAIADMPRARRRASMGAVMDELAWDMDMGGESWDLI